MSSTVSSATSSSSNWQTNQNDQQDQIDPQSQGTQPAQSNASDQNNQTGNTGQSDSDDQAGQTGAGGQTNPDSNATPQASSGQTNQTDKQDQDDQREQAAQSAQSNPSAQNTPTGDTGQSDSDSQTGHAGPANKQDSSDYDTASRLSAFASLPTALQVPGALSKSTQPAQPEQSGMSKHADQAPHGIQTHHAASSAKSVHSGHAEAKPAGQSQVRENAAQPAQYVQPAQPASKVEQPSESVKAAPAGAEEPILPGATREELSDLNNWYDHGDVSARRDQRNATEAKDLGKLAWAGYPPDVQGFEQELPSLQAKIGTLPQEQRDRYTGQAMAFTAFYENSPDPKVRDQIDQKFAQLKQAVDRDYNDTLSNDLTHAESQFNQPYGYAYLSADDQKKADKLEDLREDFHAAKTPEEREEIFSEATQLRAGLQNKIADTLVQQREHYQQQWDTANADLKKALSEATDLQGEEVNSGSRLTYFGHQALTDQLHTRAFTDDFYRHPEKYKALQDWENDLRTRDKAAEAADKSRTIPPPVLPPFMSFSDVTRQPPLPNTHYGSNLLDDYQYAQRRMVAGMRRISVLNDPGGPRYEEYVKQYSPPKPDWQQELEEGICRFTTGMLPGVNMFTDQICPRSPLDDTSRLFIDIFANATGGVISEGLADKPIGELLSNLDVFKAPVGAAGDVLNKLFGKMKLSGKASVDEALRELPGVARPGDRADPALAEARQRIDGSPSLPESYAATHPLSDTGKSGVPGVGQDAEKKNFVSIRGQDYHVQWDEDMNAYRAYSDNPFQAPIPVARNAKGEWEPVAEPGGLKGGMPPKRPPLTAQERQAIGDYIAAHPDATYKDLATTLQADRSTIAKIARERGLRNITHPHMAPDRRQEIGDYLVQHPNESFASVSRQFHSSEYTISEIANERGVVHIPGQGKISADQRKSIIDDIAQNPGANYDEIAARHGVSQRTVANYAHDAGLRDARYRPYVKKTTAEERREIINYKREHPDARTSDLSYRFNRSTHTIRHILNSSNATPAPSAAFGSAGQQEIDQALRARPTASYEDIAHASHAQPDAVRDYAELHGLERGGLGPDDNAPPLPPDLPMPPASDIDNAINDFEPLTAQQKAEINKLGSTLSPEVLSMSTGKPAWMIESYMKTPEYSLSTGLGPKSVAQQQLLDEVFGKLTDADRNVIDEWRDMDSEHLAELLGKPKQLIDDYRQFKDGPVPSTSSR